MQSGDTYPPLRGLAADQNGTVDLTAAASMRALCKGSTHIISLNAVVINPVLVIGSGAAQETYNWIAVFSSEAETSVPDIYVVQLEVTWASGSIETFPNSRAAAPLLIIEQANEAT